MNNRRSILKKICSLGCLVVGLAFAPAQAQNLYGSIVFSQESGGGYAWGMSWSYDGRSSAQARAIDECRNRGGSNCFEIGWFNNSCGSLAIGDNNGAGAGWGETSSNASNNAMATCRQYNRNCRSVITRCTN